MNETPLEAAHRRIIELGNDLGTTVEARGIVHDDDSSEKTYDFLLERFGLARKDVDSFMRDGVGAFFEAMAHGAEITDALASVLITTFLTGIEFARDPRGDVV
jgi:hypothetical protein